MQVITTPIADVVAIKPAVYGDERGFFFESFNLAAFSEATGVERSWVQDNHSRSSRGVLRGLHFQKPRPQGKLVRCSAGSIFDVAVDVRRSSPTFLQWVGLELSAENRLQLWVPEGFAHGFVVTSNIAEVQYKTTDYYEPASERGVVWNDPTLDIEWPIDTEPILSERDAALPRAADADLFD
jgi:dTDP-4-dehydrorhamnose 3,5-epimerase